MKFVCPQANLNKAINTVSKAISTRTTIPILKGILMKVEGNELTLVCSNLDLSIETKILIDSGEDGSLVISSKLLSEIVRRLPNAMVSVETDGKNNLHLSCLNSDFNIVTMSADEYPSIGTVDPIKKIDINKKNFIDLIRKTSFSASIDEKKGILVGCLIKFKKSSIEMVALDGFRMAIAKMNIIDGIEGKLVLPARILNDINKILVETEGSEFIRFSIDEKRAEIVYEDTSVVARLLEGDFIKYEDILPKEYKTRLVVEKNELIDSIERASLFAKEGKNNLIKINVEKKALVINSNSEEGNVNEVVNAEVDGDKLAIGFNSKYVVDALKSLDDSEVVMEMTNSTSSCLIKPVEGDAFTYLVLPVRITA